MTTLGTYPVDVRELAVPMVFDRQDRHDSQGAVISSIASESGTTPETLRKWVHQERPTGAVVGVSPPMSFCG